MNLLLQQKLIGVKSEGSSIGQWSGLEIIQILGLKVLQLFFQGVFYFSKKENGGSLDKVMAQLSKWKWLLS